jgi:hypothetical protein
MSDEEPERGGRVVDDAIADTNPEILAAPDRVAGADDTPAHAAPPRCVRRLLPARRSGMDRFGCDPSRPPGWTTRTPAS